MSASAERGPMAVCSPAVPALAVLGRCRLVILACGPLASGLAPAHSHVVAVAAGPPLQRALSGPF
eukprot:13688691-Alexandrium_andersonii.AAC.1